MTNAQNWLDKNYLKEERKELTKLNISHKELGGSLKVENFPKLEELYFHDNQLKKLDLSGCVNLKELDCHSNKIIEITLKECSKLESINLDHNKLKTINLSSCYSLVSLHCGDNDFSSINFLKILPNPNGLEKLLLWGNTNLTGELKFLTAFIGLKVLNIKDCSLSGSLKPLKDSELLEEIDISNADIEEGLEYLPENCKKVFCSYDYRSEKKIAKVNKELGKFLDSDLVSDGKHPNLYHNLVKMKRRKCDSVSSVIPLERLYVIRSNIKNFVDKWGKRDKKNESELSKLKSPQELRKSWLTNRWTIHVAQN